MMIPVYNIALDVVLMVVIVLIKGNRFRVATAK
jgi:hypothetical protein